MSILNASVGIAVNSSTPVTVPVGSVVGGVLSVLGNGVGVTATAPGANITNQGEITSTLSVAGVLGTVADAVDLKAGGTLANAAGALIQGSDDGIEVTGGAGNVSNAQGGTITGADVAVLLHGTPVSGSSTVTNAGTMGTVGSTNVGVSIDLGNVVNSTTGVINGAVNGVLSTAGADVNNAGSITASAVNGVGVDLAAGGDIVNAVSGTINGTVDGILSAGATTVNNAGKVIATAPAGVGIALATGGDIVNTTSGKVQGVIEGVLANGVATVENGGIISATAPGGIGVDLALGGTVTNSGTITGAPDSSGNAVAVMLGGAGGSKLVLDAGQVLNGAAKALGSGNTLELGLGTGTNTIADIGGTIDGFGTTLVDANVHAAVTGGVADTSITVGPGASLAIGGPVAGDVSVDMLAGSVLDLAGQVASGSTVNLGGGSATVNIGSLGNFAGAIVGLGGDDHLSLGVLSTGTTVSFDPTTGLTVTGTQGTHVLGVSLAAGTDPATLGLTVDALGTGVMLGVGGSSLVTIGATGTGCTGTGGTTDPGTGTGGTGTGGTGTGTGTGGTTDPGTGTGGTGTGGTGTGTGTGGTTDPGTGTGGTGTGGTGTGTGTGGTTDPGTGMGGTGTGGTGTGTGGTGTGTGTGGTGTGTGGTGTVDPGAGTGTGGSTNPGSGTGGTGTGGTGTGSLPGTGTGAGTGDGGTGALPGTGTGGSGTGNGTGLLGGETGTGLGTGGPGSGIPGGTVSPLPAGFVTVPGSIDANDIQQGSAVAYGSGAAQGDLVSIDPQAAFEGRGRFTLSGHVASATGGAKVELTASIDGQDPVNIGTATVNADGTWSLSDFVGRHLQGFITATVTDASGNQTSAISTLSLEAGMRGRGHVAEVVDYNQDGTAAKSITEIHRDQSRTVYVGEGNQTFRSDTFDTFKNHGAPSNTFVFDAGHGAGVIEGFRARGSDHDTVSLSSEDFAHLASVFHNMQNVEGGVTITGPVSGDTVTIAGVSKAELRHNVADFTFHP